MNLRQSITKEEPLSSCFPFTSQVPRYQCPVSSLQGLSQDGDEAGQGWAGRDLVYSTSKKESTYPGQFLRLSEQHVVRPPMLLWLIFPEDGICVLEVHFRGKQVPGCASVTTHVSIFPGQVQFTYFHTFKWGPPVRGLTRVLESGLGCAMNHNSLFHSLRTSTLIQHALLLYHYLFWMLIRNTPSAGNTKVLQKSRNWRLETPGVLSYQFT